MKSDIDARVEYDDNIFLTTEPHNGVSSIKLTPTLSGIVRELNWDTEFEIKLRGNKYSDSNLNSNDQYFNLTGRYLLERNIFSLNVNHNFDSNLNVDSTDFGISGFRVNRKMQSISPQYTRLLSERANMIFTYTYRDVDYLEADSTAYRPYISESGSASLTYGLTERDKLNFSLSVVDYTSKDELVTYQMFVSNIGIEHEVSETLSSDFMVGISRQNVTNLTTYTFDFFGKAVTHEQEIDTTNRNLVLNAGITQLLEYGSIVGRVNRSNFTDSFGGINQVDRFTLGYEQRLSSLWRYTLNGRYEDITAIGLTSSSTDRDVFMFEAISYYSFSRNWSLNASYRYLIRKFKSVTSGDRAAQ